MRWLLAAACWGTVGAATGSVQEPARTDPSKDELAVVGMLALGMFEEARRENRVPPDVWGAAAEAAGAFQAGDAARAYRSALRAVHRLRGLRVDEAIDEAIDLNVVLDRALAEPGESVRVRPEGPKIAATSLEVTLLDGAGRVLKPLGELGGEGAPRPRELAIPCRALKAGLFEAAYRLKARDGRILAEGRRRFRIVPGIAERIGRLRKLVDRMSADPRVSADVRRRTAIESVTWKLEVLERARREFVGTLVQSLRPMTALLVRWAGQGDVDWETDPVDPERDMPDLEAMAKALEAGKDPLAGRAGDLRLAYRSPVDGTLQPFRVFVPSGGVSGSPRPAVVALHGAGCDENTYFDRYPEPRGGGNLFKKLGQERGYVLVCPRGRGPMAGYEGNGGRDVLDVVERVKLLWGAASEPVFLTGHSMGAHGTWILGTRHPDLFAAAAPVAGIPPDPSAVPLERAVSLPVLFVAAARDRGVPVERAREWARRAQRVLKRLRYVEYPDDDHYSIGVNSLPAVFDFFDVCRKPGK
ncbi:MAG TPA: hypothetical protein VNO22_06135 [Planctomycetota bacterium]|nr:hypothetical protein [Planctomycetota bacterium]